MGTPPLPVTGHTRHLDPRSRWVLGRNWESQGLRQTGWLLLPLRSFLGITFVIAALQKLGTPSFFDPSSPTSVQAQMHAVATTSPIGPLLNLGSKAGWLVGVVVALAELAIGIGTLLGLKARVAACGGAVLSLLFFLTISWETKPFYYGADIVFLFAWTPFIASGAAGVLSLDALAADPPSHDARPVTQRPRPRTTARRSMLAATASGMAIAAITTIVGRLTAPLSTQASPLTASADKGSRIATGSEGGGRQSRSAQSPKPSTSSPSSSSPSSPPSGTAPIALTSDVLRGQGHPFTDPKTGNPAWLIRTRAGTFKAFSAVCTHAGCTVNYNQSATQFDCPCHGGVFNADTGQVLAGPPPTPLTAIPVTVVSGKIYAA